MEHGCGGLGAIISTRDAEFLGPRDGLGVDGARGEQREHPRLLAWKLRRGTACLPVLPRRHQLGRRIRGRFGDDPLAVHFEAESLLLIAVGESVDDLIHDVLEAGVPEERRKVVLRRDLGCAIEREQPEERLKLGFIEPADEPEHSHAVREELIRHAIEWRLRLPQDIVLHDEGVGHDVPDEAVLGVHQPRRRNSKGAVRTPESLRVGGAVLSLRNERSLDLREELLQCRRVVATGVLDLERGLFGARLMPHAVLLKSSKRNPGEGSRRRRCARLSDGSGSSIHGFHGRRRDGGH